MLWMLWMLWMMRRTLFADDGDNRGSHGSSRRSTFTRQVKTSRGMKISVVTR